MFSFLKKSKPTATPTTQPQGPSPEELKRQKEEEQRKKLADGISKIKRLCSTYLASHNASDYAISDKLLESLMFVERGDVFLGQDGTIFKTGKSGFAITASGVYCVKKGMSMPKCTSYIFLAEATDFSSPRGTSDIFYDGNLLACASTDVEDLIDLFMKIGNIARGMYF